MFLLFFSISTLFFLLSCLKEEIAFLTSRWECMVRYSFSSFLVCPLVFAVQRTRDRSLYIRTCIVVKWKEDSSRGHVDPPYCVILTVASAYSDQRETAGRKESSGFPVSHLSPSVASTFAAEYSPRFIPRAFTHRIGS